MTHPARPPLELRHDRVNGGFRFQVPKAAGAGVCYITNQTKGFDPMSIHTWIVTATASFVVEVETPLAGTYAIPPGAQQVQQVASNSLPYTDRPADGETITVGDDVFEVVDDGVNTVINDDDHIAVLRGANGDAFADNLVAAGNAVTVGNEHASVTLADTVTPAKANGTHNLLWVRVGSTVFVYQADAPGGNPVAGVPPSLVFSDDLANVGPWDIANLNLSDTNPVPANTIVVVKGRWPSLKITTAGDVHVIAVQDPIQWF